MRGYSEEDELDDSAGYEREFVADFYDQVDPYRRRPDVAFYTALATEHGGPVLELGCGTGRVLLPTARAGVEITGVDVSDRMLSVCRSKLAEEPPEVRGRVRLSHADMRSFDLGRRFGLVTIPFRPFQHLVTVEEQMACLARAHRHLEPGGTLALDVFNPSLKRLVDPKYLQESEPEPTFVMPDGRSVVRTGRNASVDLVNQVIHAELIYYVAHPDGTQERLVHDFPMRYFFRYELEHLLVRAGFKVEAVHGDFDRSPVGASAPGELVFVARRG